MTYLLPLAANSNAPAQPRQRDSEAWRAAEKLEATFLAEMLKASGFGEQKNSFSGSAGEDQFASFHRQAVADKLVETGGVGLAEMFYRSMMESKDDT